MKYGLMGRPKARWTSPTFVWPKWVWAEKPECLFVSFLDPDQKYGPMGRPIFDSSSYRTISHFPHLNIVIVPCGICEILISRVTNYIYPLLVLNTNIEVCLDRNPNHSRNVVPRQLDMARH